MSVRLVAELDEETGAIECPHCGALVFPGERAQVRVTHEPELVLTLLCECGGESKLGESFEEIAGQLDS